MTVNRPTISIVLVIAIVVLLLQGLLAVVSLGARAQVAEARASLAEPAPTCEQLARYDPLLETYETRPLEAALLDASFLWVLLMIPFNVAAFTIMAPQIEPLWLRRVFVIGMGLTLAIVVLSLNAIGLTRCALAS